MRTRALRACALVVVVLGGLCAASTTASAQEDPYGSTSTTEPTGTGEVTCELSSRSAAPGETVTAIVSNVPDGEQVRVLVNGDEVASGSAAVDPSDGATATVRINFPAPSRPPGRHTIAAVGATFTADCGRITGGGRESEVRGASVERSPDGGSGSGGGGGSLPFTGANILLLLVVGALLLLVGRTAVSGSRRRRRRVRLP